MASDTTEWFHKHSLTGHILLSAILGFIAFVLVWFFFPRVELLVAPTYPLGALFDKIFGIYYKSVYAPTFVVAQLWITYSLIIFVAIRLVGMAKGLLSRALRQHG